MKAYYCDGIYTIVNGCISSRDIVFGNSADDARENYFKGNSVGMTWKAIKDYADKDKIVFKRLKQLDGCENDTPMLITEKAIEICGWIYYLLGSTYSRINSHIADKGKNEIDESFFDKKHFENNWAKATSVA